MCTALWKELSWCQSKLVDLTLHYVWYLSISILLCSALKDRRFPPMKSDEIPKLQCTVSFLHSFQTAGSWDDWRVGTHGIIADFQGMSRCPKHVLKKVIGRNDRPGLTFYLFHIVFLWHFCKTAWTLLDRFPKAAWLLAAVSPELYWWLLSFAQVLSWSLCVSTTWCLCVATAHWAYAICIDSMIVIVRCLLSHSGASRPISAGPLTELSIR